VHHSILAHATSGTVVVTPAAYDLAAMAHGRHRPTPAGGSGRHARTGACTGRSGSHRRALGRVSPTGHVRRQGRQMARALAPAVQTRLRPILLSGLLSGMWTAPYVVCSNDHLTAIRRRSGRRPPHQNPNPPFRPLCRLPPAADIHSCDAVGLRPIRLPRPRGRAAWAIRLERAPSRS